MSRLLLCSIAIGALSALALVVIPAGAGASARGGGDTVEAITDGGFENSTCHDVDTPYGPLPYCEDPAWTTGDVQASICGQPGCAAGAAHGDGYLRLGGAYMPDSNPMTGTVSQTVDLPPGPKTLTFAIKVDYENPFTTAAASVEVDGSPAFGASSGEVSPYATESVDLSGYSGEHEISFEAECSHGLSMPVSWTCDGFGVDDVSLPVERPAPSVEIAAGPPAKTDRHRVRFAFAADNASGLRCRLDHAAPFDCGSPLHLRTGPGAHHLRVRAVADSGERSAAAIWSWRTL